ncbi:MAG TPA: DUF4870 domain-containing protein [Acidimicrobiia bacterium]
MTEDGSNIPDAPLVRPRMSESDERNWAMAAHLSALIAFISIPSLVGPLVVWLIKKDESPLVAAHGADALNFNISVLIYTIVGILALAFIGFVTLGIGLLLAIPAAFVAFVLWLVFVVQGALAASRGEQFKYPWTIHFVN